MNTKIILLTSTLVILTAITLFLRSTKPKESKERLVVGIAANYAPWISIDQKGLYKGFDIDVIEAVAKKINKELVLKDLGSMPALFMALEQKKIDCVIWGLSITSDRLKKMSMVRYQGSEVNSFPLIFWKNIPQGVKDLEDMKEKTVCVEPASSQEVVMQSYPDVKRLSVDKVDDALLNLRYGKADAALVEPAIAKKFMAKYPEIKSIDIQLPEENIVKGVGICVGLENKKLTAELKQAVQKLESEGLIAASEKKWGIE